MTADPRAFCAARAADGGVFATGAFGNAVFVGEPEALTTLADNADALSPVPDGDNSPAFSAPFSRAATATERCGDTRPEKRLDARGVPRAVSGWKRRGHDCTSRADRASQYVPNARDPKVLVGRGGTLSTSALPRWASPRSYTNVWKE